MTRASSRTPLFAALAVVLALVVAGCAGAEPDEAAAGGSGHNDADVAFAGDMIQHHAQALQMVDLTLGRDLDPAVARLAEDIRAAQAPEIEQMTDWLEEWDEPVPETVRDHANAHGDGHAGTDAPGMADPEEVAALEEAPDSDFQRMWLEMMVEHHQGAVAMAEALGEHGEYGPALALAEDIARSQRREIETMEKLLQQQ